jgi:hypothetical protein
MSTQLRADVVRALDAASDQVRAHRATAAKLVDDVMRLMDGTLRFLEPDQRIWEARRVVLERLEGITVLMDPEDGRVVAGLVGGQSPRAISTARARTIEAIKHRRTKVLGQGRVNAAGDRVGLGQAGALIR